MKFKIVADSSCDLKKEYFHDKFNDDEVGFEVISFAINVGDKEFIDDENEIADDLITALDDKKVTSYTSCPSPASYGDACNAEFNFVVTISQKLSGSYNSAIAASDASNNKIFVVDSKGTGGMEELVIDKLYELIKAGLTYEEIKEEIIKYRDSLELYFTIANFDNLVNKGRIKAGLAKLIKAIKIRLLCKAKEGEISLHKTCLTLKQVYVVLTNEMKKHILEKKKKCVITYVDNLEEATELKERIEKLDLFEEVVLRKTRGLNTFYALRKALVVAF